MRDDTSDRRALMLVAPEPSPKCREITITGNDLTLRQLVRIARDPRVRVVVSRNTLGTARRSAALLLEQRPATAPRTLPLSTGCRGTLPVRGVARRAELRPADALPAEIVRGAMLLRLNALVLGYSGASVELIEALAAMLNTGVVPVIPAHAAVEHGDRAGLECLAMLLRGQGRFIVVRKPRELARAPRGMTIHPATRLSHVSSDIASTSSALAVIESPARPAAVADNDIEALVSGASLSTAALALAVHDAQLATRSADVAVALGLEAIAGRLDAFLPIANYARPHRGQCAAAAHVESLVMGSKLIGETTSAAPLPAAFRRTPSSHGGSRDLIQFVRQVIVRELNAATHDRLVIDGEIYETANGDGEPIGSAAEALAIALRQLAWLSGERTRVVMSLLEELSPAGDGGEAVFTRHPQSAVASALHARTALEQLHRTLAVELIIATHGVARRCGQRREDPRSEPRARAASTAIASADTTGLKDSLGSANVYRVRRLVATGRLLGPAGDVDEDVRHQQRLFPHLFN